MTGDLKGDSFVRATAFQGTNDMRVFQQEIFGPFVTVASFSDYAEGIPIAYDTIYGLRSDVWTRYAAAVYEVSQVIRAGRLWVSTHVLDPAGAGFQAVLRRAQNRSAEPVQLPGGQERVCQPHVARVVLMTHSKLLPIGATVPCEDGECGVLHRLVVDPLAGTVTLLVVEPPHRQGAGRLVPVGLISTSVPEVRLDCTLEQFGVLEPAEDSQSLPGALGSWGLGSEQVLSWPFYGMAVFGSSAGGGSAPSFAGPVALYQELDLEVMGAGPQLLIKACIPIGEVEVRRGDRVHALDGDIGKV